MNAFLPFVAVALALTPATALSPTNNTGTLDHRNMSAWYEPDVQTELTEFKPIAVAVDRESVRLQISDRRHGQ